MEHHFSRRPEARSKTTSPITRTPWRPQGPVIRHILDQTRLQRDPSQSPPVSTPPVPSPDPDPAVFPDFPALLPELRYNLEENLYNNAHHFYRVAALYPNDPAKMEETFLRYAVGANFLESAYQFLGFDTDTAPWLSLGTGLAYKGFTFATDGVLQLDYQMDLSDSIKVEAKLDLSASSGDPQQVDRADVGLGLVGHF